ncbi:MAG TPA: type II secretion system protein [Mesotoga infera]|jgi:type II secretory pathway pseudopilin PulG|nr:type II secretion system protein [Mesotoga sp.]HNR79740.1 type II secretion system protein [Mesotoga infera]HNS66593.1 type II secretion system protein [Mesotoga infera]HON26739.1 type II secretion system protein [Mesotoga infera]HPD39545.1 type II secretion system protein [Mesotoga infera]
MKKLRYGAGEVVRMEESRRLKSRVSGFSLVEVLMSLLIIVVIVATILPLLANSMRQAHKNRFVTTELAVVQNDLEEEIFVSTRGQSYSVNVDIDGSNVTVSGELVTKNFAEGKQIGIFLRSR